MKKLLIVIAAVIVGACVSSCANGGVTILEDELTYTLDNGIVQAMVAKASGDLVSLKYNGTEVLATRMNDQGQPDLILDPPGANFEGVNRGMTDHQYGFWSHDAMGPKDSGDAVAKITIDPKKNHGKRAEVAVVGISGGRKMGTGPGAPHEGQFVTDIEIRYAIESQAKGVYTYCYFHHPAEYEASSIGEARFCIKLAPTFDFISVAKDVNEYYPKDLVKGDKYIYTSPQSLNRAYGWSSTQDNIGVFFINPSMEYMSGGPTKVEFLGHRDTNAIGAATILNYWRSSHYGGADVSVEAGENWQKVIGPFMIYITDGADPQAIYNDAKAMVDVESAKWPYAWVNCEGYATSKQRATVSGKLTLNDPITSSQFENLNVGLAHAEYDVVRAGMDGQSISMPISWQKDAKNYQFWTIGQADGTFTIPNVVPGKYTLYAFANGVLGQFEKADITVAEGQVLDLGEIEWTPVRYGDQLWEVGIANRNGVEFCGESLHRDPTVVLKYAEQFPNDVTFRPGQSDPAKDWFYIQVPHNATKDPKVSPFFGVMGAGNDTPYNVVWNNDKEFSGNATLRLAIAGTSARFLNIVLNGEKLGQVELGQNDGIVSRHGSHGIWYEKTFEFPASKIVSGENTLSIVMPAGSLNDGVLYDYVRLEAK